MSMNIDLADIEAFGAVASERSFHLAAGKLGLSPSAVTRRVQKLEDLMGVRLLDRTTRSVNLTPAGQEFLNRALDLQSQLEQMVLDLRNDTRQDTSIVAVACIPSASHHFLPPVIERFGAAFPDTRIRILDLDATGVLEAVKASEADLGIDFVGQQEPGLEFLPLREDPFVLAVNRAHRLAQRAALDWDDLAGERCISVWKGSGNRLVMDLALAAANKTLGWHYETRHVTTALAFVEAGMGVAALPRSALPAGEHPIVTAVPLENPSITRTLGAVRRRDRRLSRAAQAFWDAMLAEWTSRKPRARQKTARGKERAGHAA